MRIVKEELLQHLDERAGFEIVMQNEYRDNEKSIPEGWSTDKQDAFIAGIKYAIMLVRDYTELIDQ